MFGRSQGVPVHRWIGFILFKNQSTLKKNKLIKCKTTNSAGTIVSQCAQLESSQSAVGAIYGSQNCLQVPQHLTSIFQLIMLDSAIPAEVSCTYDMTWTFVMCMFMLEIECKAKRLLYNENILESADPLNYKSNYGRLSGTGTAASLWFFFHNPQMDRSRILNLLSPDCEL